MSRTERYLPYEAPAREIARDIIEARVPSTFPESYRLLLGELLVEGIHDGIEFANSMSDPVPGEESQGEIYLRGYMEGYEDAGTNEN